MIKHKILSLLLSITIAFVYLENCNTTILYKENEKLPFSVTEKKIIFSNAKDSLMYVMNYFVHSDSLVLRSQSRNVDLDDTSTLNYLINRMYATVTNSHKGAQGIAAPQIGINRNIILLKRLDKKNEPFEVYLNPCISNYSDSIVKRTDACFSLPNVNGCSKRAFTVDVEYDLLDGSHHFESIHYSYLAYLFQHEIDHLNGILFVDRSY